jgi:hypothetical protein
VILELLATNAADATTPAHADRTHHRRVATRYSPSPAAALGS